MCGNNCGYKIVESDFRIKWSTQAWTGTSKHTISGETWYEWRDENQGAEKIQYRSCERDRIYTYYYSKTEAKTSTTEIFESETIRNVQKWVKYRAK